MIWNVSGTLELLICSECDERWVGQTGEPRTQEWMKHHASHVGAPKVGRNLPSGLGLGNVDAPRGFSRSE